VRPAPRPVSKRVAKARPVRRMPRAEPVETVAAPPPVPLYPVPVYQNHFGSWAQVFGNYEERDATGTNLIACCKPPIPLALSESSRANTVGFLGGIDYTVRGINAPGDGLIFGLLSGYMSTDIRVTNTSVSNDPRIRNGSGSLKATLSGPSAGVYGLYFLGPFSADLTFKADILDLKEKFSDLLAFGGPSSAGYKAFPFVGSGSGGLTNLSTFGNVYYRLFNLGSVWFEPTVGFQYTDSLFDADAKRMRGLDDGYLLMVQGGVRMGTDYVFQNASRVTTTLTGLAYDDVRVRGGFTQGAIFQTGNDLLARSDEGKVRGRGVLAVNYDMGRGLNLFVQGDVYGGENLFGAGGKGGLRVEW
jgi:hypothetical protein